MRRWQCPTCKQAVEPKTFQQLVEISQARVPLSEVKEALRDQVERIRHRERNCRLGPPIRETRAEKAERLGRASGLDNAAAGLKGFINLRFPASTDSERGEPK